jgi:hypothetical protein
LSHQGGSDEEDGGNLGFAKSARMGGTQVGKGQTSGAEIKPRRIEEIGGELSLLKASSVKIQKELRTKVVGGRQRERWGGLRSPGTSAYPTLTGHRDNQSSSGT